MGPDLVFDDLDKVQLIKERFKTAQNRQKSYAKVRRKDLEFLIGDFMHLKISPMKGLRGLVRRESLVPDILSLTELGIISERWIISLSCLQT